MNKPRQKDQEKGHHVLELGLRATPSKSNSKNIAIAEMYPGSGTKLRSRQSLRTPQQFVPLRIDDRNKNRRASKSFVFADQVDADTPRTHIEAFIGVADTAQKVQLSARRSGVKRARTSQSMTLPDSEIGVMKAPRVRELAAAGGNSSRRKVSSPGSKFTPRTNVWNLLQTGEEKTPVERTEDLGEPSSPDVQTLTSLRNSGQRVSISPIDVSSASAESKGSRRNSRTPGRKARRSFHLNTSQPEADHTLAPIKNSGQRVSVSPLNVTDIRVDSEDARQLKIGTGRSARRSFHLDVPQADEEEELGDESVESTGTKQPLGSDSSKDLVDAVFSRKNSIEGNVEGGESPENLPLDQDGRESVPQARRRAKEATGTQELLAENTSLVVGGGTDVITQGTSFGPTTGEISPTNQYLSSTRKSSISKAFVHVGANLSLSAVVPPELDDSSGERDGGRITGDEHGTERQNLDSEEGIENGEENALEQGQKSDNDEEIHEEGSNAQEPNDGEINFSHKSLRESSVKGDKNTVAEYEASKTGNSIRVDAMGAADGENITEALETGEEQEREAETNLQSNAAGTEGAATAVVDPASVYDLSEGSSSSKLETPKAKNKRSKSGSSGRKRTSSAKRSMSGGSNKRKSAASSPSSQRSSSTKRKHLNYSAAQHQAGSHSLASPVQGYRSLRSSPKSSTPIDRSRRFFSSTKIQRSVTEFFQGDQELASAASAITPKAKDLFSDISPIRPPGALQRAGMSKDRAQDSVYDYDEDDDDHSDNNQVKSVDRRTSKRTSRTNVEDIDIEPSSDDDLPSFSSLTTPHIDLRKRVFLSSLHRDSRATARSLKERAHQLVPKPAHQKRAEPKKSTKRPASSSTLPRSSLKYFAELYSDMKLSKDAIEEIEKVSELFWEDTFRALEAYALHAGRKTVLEQDVTLLMKTQRFITGTDDLHNKIRQMLPMELRTELIPCAYTASGK
ncbi:centromere protein t [Plakobranchus ocellatus]|uniref:Centromere protein t n=1 Tax=Plakobranchus ocellatus TaxID=259542 RepID=A0AAV3ZBT8_9GAST|nr:centromere protein t [Plakobranchus ocellatus]